ncbi:MAG: DUF2029 domain-containing protein [Chloroflexi bacterium]|nr:DUF2029 domain-containing protein [Chloroflexota bacterium]OJV96587.1 MAG: hypothetical protein BGO39_10035 [Chloroflexi bacterium 54-19]
MQTPPTQLRPSPSPVPFYRDKNYLAAGFIALLCLGLLVWLDLVFIMPIKRLDVPNLDNDLSVFWSAARTVWQGGNPYDFAPGSLFHQVANSAGGDSDVFLSPYFLTLLFMPLAALPLNVAALVWLLFSQAALGFSVYLIVKLAGQRFTPPVLFQTLLLVVFWRYSFEVMILNNLSILMLGATVVSYYCSRTGRPFRAGVAASLLLLKPQLFFLTLPLLLVVPTAEKEGSQASWLNRTTYRRWLGFGAACAVFAVYSFAVFPGWLGEWLRSAGGRYTPQFDSEMASARSFAALVTGDALVTPVYIGLAGLLCLAALGLWWRNRDNARDFTFLLAVVVCLNLLAAPYTRSYDFCLLLIPLLFSFFKLRQLEKAARKAGGREFPYRLFWWALLILAWPLHLVAITTTFTWENLVTLSLLAASGLVWRRYAAQESAQNEAAPPGLVSRE